jgi:hypothetical protein
VSSAAVIADWIAVDAEVAPVLSAAKSATASTNAPFSFRWAWMWFVRCPAVPSSHGGGQ